MKLKWTVTTFTEHRTYCPTLQRIYVILCTNPLPLEIYIVTSSKGKKFLTFAENLRHAKYLVNEDIEKAFN